MVEPEAIKDIDVSVLLSGKGYAVNCRTKEEAKELIRCLRLACPVEKVDKWWDTSSNYCWEYSKEDTCYSFDEKDTVTGKWRGISLGFADRVWFEEEGYNVILFSDLASEDLKESELPIEFLMGVLNGK